MRWLLGLCLLLSASPAVGDPGPTREERDALVGCWDVSAPFAAGATLRLRAKDSRDVVAIATFRERPRGGPSTMASDALWIEATRELEVSCRPRTHHGSFCRVRRDGDSLRVRVFALRHGGSRRGKLVETLAASRCAKRS